MFPAHTVLGRAPEPQHSACDYLYIQGRNDRLHAFRAVDLPLDSAFAVAFAEVPANWHWLVLPEADYVATREIVDRMANDHSLGVITLDADGRPTKVRRAPARPGIFGRHHPDLYSAWRKLSDW